MSPLLENFNNSSPSWAECLFYVFPSAPVLLPLTRLSSLPELWPLGVRDCVFHMGITSTLDNAWHMVGTQ